MIARIERSTPRLILRSVTPPMIHELFRTKNREEIMRFFGVGEAGYERYRDMHENGMETHRLSLFFFLLYDKKTEQPIGECGFHTWNRTHSRAELFYGLRSDSDKHKGLMTEALRVVLDYGFTALNLHRVQALVADYNTPSVKLLQRYGFTKEGRMREDYLENGVQEDSDCYSLLKHEWHGMP